MRLYTSTKARCAPEAAKAKEAAALEAEATSFEGLEEKSDWPQGEGTGCRVLEKFALEELRGQILQPPPEAEPTEPPPGEPAEGEEEPTEPRFADGTDALDTLAFDNEWFEENLSSLRGAIFENLSSQKRYLDRVDIPAACEEVRRDLDQRLRRHTNRKGEVQARLTCVVSRICNTVEASGRRWSGTCRVTALCPSTRTQKPQKPDRIGGVVSRFGTGQIRETLSGSRTEVSRSR